jgi:hypothetical protein
MTHRTLLGAAATALQFSILDYSGPPCVPPANYGAGRFVWYAAIAGFGYRGANSGADASYTLFNFNAQKNEYEPVSALPRNAPDGYDYGAIAGGWMAMVDATTLEIFGRSVTAGACDRAQITIAADPGISMTYSGHTLAAYTEGAANVTNVRSKPCGFNSASIYGFWLGPVSGVYSATNGYIQKVPSVGAALRNATALRSSLPTTNSQGQFVKSIALLGGATPNGYVVADVSDNVQSAGVGTSRYQLVNCNATPVAVGTAVTFAGEVALGNTDRMLPLSATQVVVFDRELSPAMAIGPRASLLNTNSATVPTTLTKGAELIFPPPSGYTLAQISYAIVLPGENAANNFFVAGKTIVWVRWYLVAGTVVTRPMLLTSTGASNLTVSQLGADLRGKNINTVVGGVTEGPIVSAPGGKAVVFARRGRDMQYEQFTYQL